MTLSCADGKWLYTVEMSCNQDGIDSATYVSAYDQFALTNNILCLAMSLYTMSLMWFAAAVCIFADGSYHHIVLYRIVLYCISGELHKCIIECTHSQSQSICYTDDPPAPFNTLVSVFGPTQ